MKRTRQRFLWSVGGLTAVQGALATVVALPLLADAGLEGAHTILRLCHHSFRPHYLHPLTLLAALLMGLVLYAVSRFATAVRRTAQRTRAVTGPLIAACLPVLSQRMQVLVYACGMPGRVDVIETPEPLAFCAGFRRPRVYISTGLCALLDDAELTAVLLHEEYHRRRREPLRLVLLAGLGHALSIWSGLGLLLAEARTETEVAADAAAVARSGSVQALARALVKVLERPAGPDPGFAPDLAIPALSPTAARIDCLTGAAAEPFPPLAWGYFGALAGVLTVPAAALLALAAASNLHSLLHPCHMA